MKLVFGSNAGAIYFGSRFRLGLRGLPLMSIRLFSFKVDGLASQSYGYRVVILTGKDLRKPPCQVRQELLEGIFMEKNLKLLLSTRLIA